MAAGVPMYYLTAHSRAASAHKGAVVDDGGFRTVLTGIILSSPVFLAADMMTSVAFDKFRNDISHILPSRNKSAGSSTNVERRTGRAVDEGEEERHGMLRGDQLEMSER